MEVELAFKVLTSCACVATVAAVAPVLPCVVETALMKETVLKTVHAALERQRTTGNIRSGDRNRGDLSAFDACVCVCDDEPARVVYENYSVCQRPSSSSQCAGGVI